jgi:hypothetical protein
LPFRLLIQGATSLLCGISLMATTAHSQTLYNRTLHSQILYSQTLYSQALPPETLPVPALPAGTPATESPAAQPIPNSADYLCYIQMQNGQVVDLSRICGTRTPTANPSPPTANPSSPNAAAAPPPPPNFTPETNLEGLDIYNGGQSTTPCFGLDAQGKPCPNAR